MRRVVLTLIGCTLIGSLLAQNKSKDLFVVDKPILLNVENEAVDSEEFWRVYSKNNVNANAIDPKSVDEYLELYINFKLKVKEAERLGYDTIKRLQTELAGYRRQLAQPYLTDQDVTESLVQEAAARSLEEVNALHILIKVDANAEPADTTKAYRKAIGYKKKIKNEQDFRRIARQYSDDNSAKTNDGDLGYFKVFDMIYPFESAAYNAKVGMVSGPVRTSYGYHLIYLKDRRPARGQVKCAHIMVRSVESDDPDSKAKARKKVDEIYTRLERGENFETLAQEFSDDKGTAQNGGAMPWFSTGRMVRSFEDAAFELRNNGDFSKPVMTPYGWHIIKRIDKKELSEKDINSKDLKRRVERDRRGKKSKASFIARLKVEYAFREDLGKRNAFYKKVDDTYYDRKWKAAEKVAGLKAVMFTLSDAKYKAETKEYTQEDFAAFLEVNKRYQRRPAEPPKDIVNNLYKLWVEESITKFEDERLELKHKAFADLMKEYRDGVLLFELMNDEVWNKAVKDTTGLEAFYQKTKNNYMWKRRAHASVFACESTEVCDASYKLVKKAKKKGNSEESILESINTDSQLKLAVKTEVFETGANSVLDAVEWKAGSITRTNANDKDYIVWIKQVMESRPKEITEARGLITAAYQDHLEKEWIKTLRDRYAYSVSQEALSSLKLQKGIK